MKSILLGSWSLTDKRTEFLLDMMKKAPQDLLASLEEQSTRESVDFAAILKAFLETKDEKLRSEALSRYMRLLYSPQGISTVLPATTRSSRRTRRGRVGVFPTLRSTGSRSSFSQRCRQRRGTVTSGEASTVKN